MLFQLWQSLPSYRGEAALGTWVFLASLNEIDRSILILYLYWYLAPLGTGVILLVAGSPVPAAWKIAYAVIVACSSRGCCT